MSTSATPSRVRRILRPVLLALSVFALALAGVMAFWAPSHVVKTPLDVNLNIVYKGSGSLFDAASGSVVQKPLTALQKITVDSAASDSTNAVFVEYLCVAVDQGNPPPCPKTTDPRFVTAQTDRVAMNRRSGESVNVAKYKEAVDGKSVKHEGLTYRWPFDSQKKTYRYYDTSVQKAFDAKYAGEAKVNGMTAYTYVMQTPVVPTDVVPGIAGTFTETVTVYIEPQTGTIIKAGTHQVRKFENGDVAADITLNWDDPTIAAQVSKAQDGIDQIRLLTVIAPLVLLAIGLIAAGVFVWLLRRPRSAGRHGTPGGNDDTPQDDLFRDTGSDPRPWTPTPPAPQGQPGEYTQRG